MNASPAGTEGIGHAFLAHHLRFRPVDATFMGIAGYDALLPPAGAATASEERASLASLLESEALHQPKAADPGAWMDRSMAKAAIRLALAELDRRPRFLNPAWYTGEACFGIVSLLLPETAGEPESIRHRLAAIPDFLSDGAARLAGAACPRSWVARAQREAWALGHFLSRDAQGHPAWQEDWNATGSLAARSLQRFANALEGLPDGDPGCGFAHLELVLREVHGLPFGVDDALRTAQSAFEAITSELEAAAFRVDPNRTWRELIASPPAVADAPSAYRQWHERAMADAAHLVSPAGDYALSFTPMPDCFRALAAQSYFLSYRSPPAHRAVDGSTYWTAEGQPEPAVKSTHAVHHGSIGHHTQNARARAAPGVLARVAGTDAALGLSLLGSGTMVEGWACHAQDLMLELDHFLEPEERLLQKAAERRNMASVLVDLNLHSGAWSFADAQRCYVDAGFPKARIEGELIRNSMLPGSRAMYWLGTREIRRMRQAWRGSARSFHDRLLACGHVPVTWADQAMQRDVPPDPG